MLPLLWIPACALQLLPFQLHIGLSAHAYLLMPCHLSATLPGPVPCLLQQHCLPDHALSLPHPCSVFPCLLCLQYDRPLCIALRFAASSCRCLGCHLLQPQWSMCVVLTLLLVTPVISPQLCSPHPALARPCGLQLCCSHSVHAPSRDLMARCHLVGTCPRGSAAMVHVEP